MKEKYLFVGLGNPGREYANTHHNLGYLAIDHYARKCNVAFSKSKYQGEIAEYVTRDFVVYLVKPTTYMNLSGQCVSQCVRHFGIDIKNVVIIYDDIDLPLGSLRIRSKGSAGTHNGMRNIVECLSSTDFPRIRIGMGRNDNMSLVDYVLSPLNKLELDEINKCLPRVDAALDKFIETKGDVEKIII